MNIGSTHAIPGSVEVQTLSVVVAQLQPVAATSRIEVGANLEQLLSFMDRASRGFPGFDLIVTPEFGLQGFHPDRWEDVLVDLDGPEVARLGEKCRELGVWGVFDVLVPGRGEGTGENTAIVIDDRGEVVHTYVKLNPWTPAEPVRPGDALSVCAGPKGSRLGLVICADGDYPEVWREAAYQGANVIVRVAHYMAPWERAWEITNKAGAYCNQCYVVAANTVGLGAAYSYFGRSMILSPDGAVITEAPVGLPWLLKADLYPQLVDQLRRDGVTNNFLYTFRHRGSSCPDLGGAGDTGNPYAVYRDWRSDNVVT